MSAERARETIGSSEKIDGACLAVILREDAAIAALVGTQSIPGHGGFGHDLIPAKLVGVPLRQNRSGVAVLHRKNNDNAGISQAATAIGDLTAQMITAHAKADAAFYQILTADQKSKFNQLEPHGPVFGMAFGPGVRVAPE